MVNADALVHEEIVVNLKIIGESNSKVFKVKTDKSVGDFSDEEIKEVMGLGSEDVYLVNMGRQLDNSLTFKTLEIENES